MKQIKFVLLIIFFITITFVNSFSQRVKSFSDSLFINELQLFLKDIYNTNKFLIDKFTKYWDGDTSSKFTPEEKAKIITTSNLLLKINGRPSPHFIDYISSLVLFKDNNIPFLQFFLWHKGIDSIVFNNKNPLPLFSNITKTTILFFNENLLYKSNTIKWKIITNNYQFTIQENQPAIYYTNAMLICISNNDSTVIKDFEGFFLIANNTIKGKKGKITWEHAGYNQDSVYTLISNYHLNIARSEYKIENALLYYKYFFDKPLEGTLINKVHTYKNIDEIQYPQFISYQQNFNIKNLYPGINYKGGLTIQGSRMIGSGIKDQNAQLLIYKNDTLILTARSNRFLFRPDRILSSNTEISIKINSDSIYHPSIGFRYIVSQKTLNLFQNDFYTSKGPYYDSYHNIDMYFEQLKWQTDQPYMIFGAFPGNAIGIASFESKNYFNKNDFEKLQGMDYVHPLIAIRGYSRYKGWEEFTATELANYLKMPIHLVKEMLILLASKGFVFYDPDTETTRIKEKLYDYINANANIIDYDILRFNSRTKAPLENARLDLKTFDLIINGIESIQVSDSQNVFIFPDNQQIIMKQNRNFNFSGVVIAGLFRFEGKNFLFHYDSFKINLKYIEKLNLKYYSDKLDNYGRPVLEELKTTINYVTGELLIDKPDNKSGKFSHPEYPIFTSKENSYIYYDNKNIRNGVYKKNNFYFLVFPFTIDSLDNFNKSTLIFDGKLISSGILPDLETKLTLQKDQSLGFNIKVSNLPLYGNKGIFTDSLKLSNNGLEGNGIIKYLSSTTKSNNIVFYPDSLIAKANEFYIDYTTNTFPQTPKVYSQKNNIKWYPYKDSMKIIRTDKNFQIFNDSTDLIGDLVLTGKGLFGNGIFDIKHAKLNSNKYKFLANELYSDTTEFILKSKDKGTPLVYSNNVSSYFNFAKKQAEFNSIESFTKVNFPENKYISFLNYFQWDMNKHVFTMSLKGTTDFASLKQEGPIYLSVDPLQDSLNFISPLAYYDYKNFIIKATKVKYIDVADARIFPENEEIIVGNKGYILPLENAKIIANRYNQYHTIYNSKIDILGRKKYKGNGYFDYIDENKNVQTIFFKNIDVNDSIITIANTTFSEVDSFFLSPHFAFQGNITLRGDQKYLIFDGATQIQTMCPLLATQWIKFKTQINPDSIYIPLGLQAKNINLKNIYSGILFNYDSLKIYPAFLSTKKYHSDMVMLPLSGYLTFDRAKNSFIITTAEKFLNKDTIGNYLMLNTEECILYGEGKFDLGVNLDQVYLTTAGTFNYDLNNNKLNFDIVLGINFYIDNISINSMANDLDSLPNLPPINITTRKFLLSINNIAGSKNAKTFLEELNLFGNVKNVPDELNFKLFFSDLKMKWDESYRSFRTYGKIGLGSVNNVQINRYIDGMIEIPVRRSGDMMDIYLEIERQKWYYFGYTPGVMQILSTNKEMNDAIMAIKTRKRTLKPTKRGGRSYTYIVSTDVKKQTFYNRYQYLLRTE